MNETDFIHYVKSCTEVFYQEPDPDAPISYALALISRAEAAEARASEATAASFATATIVARIGRRLDIDSTLPVEVYCEAVEARVAELEAALAEERAANEWRTDTLPHNGVIQALVTVVVSDGVTRQWGPGGNLLSVFRWRPIPPPPQEEPTP